MPQQTLTRNPRGDRRRNRSLVLVVDDDPGLRKGLAFLLQREDCDTIEAGDGRQALRMVAEHCPDLVLLDLMMPEMDGMDVCRRLKSNEATRLIPVIMITALNNQKEKIRAIEAGADDFLSKPVNLAELRARTSSLLRMKHLNDMLDKADTVIAAMANAIEAKDTYTEGHNDRVSRLAVMIGEAVGLKPLALEQVRMGGILHDIGKIGIPDNVLNKPGPLTDEEFRLIATHPLQGAKILRPLRSLENVIDIVLSHHERFDGKGYPHGLAGEDIPLAARIVAIADCFDAMTTDRPYRKALTRDRALAELENGAGAIWDGELVGQFTELIRRRAGENTDQSSERQPT